MHVPSRLLQSVRVQAVAWVLRAPALAILRAEGLRCGEEAGAYIFVARAAGTRALAGEGNHSELEAQRLTSPSQ